MAHLSAQGPIGAGHPTSEVATTPFPVQLGSRMRDSAGNEYMYVDFTGSVYTGTPVAILSDFTAQKVGTTGRGAFGVACCPATSDNAGWVQIYGRCYVQLLGETAGVSPSDAANAPTTLSTTAQTKFWLPTTATSTGPEGLRWTSGNTSTQSGFYVDGIVVAHDASYDAINLHDVSLPSDTSNASPATSHTGHDIAVFLNYPMIKHVNVGE
jgi:hypothetical protein